MATVTHQTRQAGEACRRPVFADRARSRQSRERIAPLTVHKRRLKYEPVCPVALGGASRPVRFVQPCRLCSTVPENAGMIGA